MKSTEEIPEYVKKDSKSSIVPITVVYVGGDVQLQGYKSQNIIDVANNKYYFVLDRVCEQINRFAVHNDNGDDFVIGWFYKSNNDKFKIRFREKVKEKYAVENYPKDPIDINQIYDISEVL